MHSILVHNTIIVIFHDVATMYWLVNTFIVLVKNSYPDIIMIAYTLLPLIVSVFNFIYYLFKDQITVLCFPCNTLQDEDANKQSQGLMIVSYFTIQNWRQKVISIILMYLLLL